MILPLLPIKNAVLFPHISMPLSAVRPASVAAVERALATEEKAIIVVTQRDPQVDSPIKEDLYAIGTRGLLKKASKEGAQMELLVQGVERVAVARLIRDPGHVQVEADPRPFVVDDPNVVEALQREVLEKVSGIQGLIRAELPDISQFFSQFRDPMDQIYLMASLMGLDVEREQALLEAESRPAALRLMLSYLSHEEQILQLRRKISNRAASEMSKEQREYFLRQQLRAIQAELGETRPEEAEVGLLRERARKADLPEHIRKELEDQLSRIERLPAMAPEHQVTRSHVELILELPWRKSTADNLDLARARRVLDEDHFELKDVKERILEQLAVLKLNPNARAPILCFVGPPGVGKTSLGQSIARALGRSFERMSLGGLHDEAELRGHRRTYVGAMPGRIIQAIRRAGVNNPLVMLDEVDKLGRDFRGDPAAALMEVLDPAQNFSFRDNYLDLPFDLSRVFFVTTANTLDTIPGPLLDRMEVLRLAGYTEEEKAVIAERYLLPRQLAQAGLSPEQLKVPRETLSLIIRRYTREAGLRQLERSLGRLARRVAMRFAEGKGVPVTVQAGDLPTLLGPERFFSEEARKHLRPGVSAGLAWTQAGGEVIYVESVLLPGRDGLLMTGNLGDVMKESVQTALDFVRSRLTRGRPDGAASSKHGIHVHVPSGAVPKDGPSAGIAIAAALASLYSGRPARSDTAMTGEITLSGLVLPIGGVKEKLLAARSAGMRRVILPKANEKDMPELPEGLRRDLELIFVEEIGQALAAAISEPERAAARQAR